MLKISPKSPGEREINVIPSWLFQIVYCKKLIVI